MLFFVFYLLLFLRDHILFHLLLILRDHIRFETDLSTLCYIQLDPVDEEDEEESLIKKISSSHIRNNSSDEDLTDKDRLELEETLKSDTKEEEETLAKKFEPPKLASAQSFSRKLTNLEIPQNDDLLETLKSENQQVE